MKIETIGHQATINLGKKLAKVLRPNDFIALIGIFGAGKTYLTKGIAAGLGINIDTIVSPSFLLCNTYTAKKGIKLLHSDAQRLVDPREIFKLGMNDFENAITVVEWGDRILLHIKEFERLIKVYFTVTGNNKRLIELFLRNHN
ncbi:MAG: tRNA (adenosine(37)-N6)-threonylcarbamoyltransferase complex ATPase subunit type 1 TsaE [Candidatus Brocadiia bacterium]